MERAYRQAIALRTEGATCHNNLGYLLSNQLGRAAEAEAHFRVSVNDFRLIALFRKLREQSHLPELAAMLQAVATGPRPWWRPWHEAVAALAAGQGAAACTTDEARALYQRLSD